MTTPAEAKKVLEQINSDRTEAYKKLNDELAKLYEETRTGNPVTPNALRVVFQSFQQLEKLSSTESKLIDMMISDLWDISGVFRDASVAINELGHAINGLNAAMVGTIRVLQDKGIVTEEEFNTAAKQAYDELTKGPSSEDKPSEEPV